MDTGVGLRLRPRAWAGRRETQGFPPVIVPAARLAVVADQNPARQPLVLRSDAGRRSADPIRGAAKLKGLCCQKSAGNITAIFSHLYIFLAGVPPFWAENENAIFTALLRGQVDFNDAKDLVKNMLNINPKERLTAFQVLNYP
ncbi:hypothetical protein ZWY2020_041873 [Hordeum vulgare]|nr:hypothetical protein ZWY2020_041873 [Hordeum vulgare]